MPFLFRVVLAPGPGPHSDLPTFPLACLGPAHPHSLGRSVSTMHKCAHLLLLNETWSLMFRPDRRVRVFLPLLRKAGACCPWTEVTVASPPGNTL